MSESRHTSLPWEIIKGECRDSEGEYDTFVGHIASRGKLGRQTTAHACRVLCDGSEDQRESNARLIVRAVNSHNDLLWALEGLLEVVNVRIDDPRISRFDFARAALAKAKEETK
jgi:hypothetical protein